jgi:quinol-cytochrome oxidoreductase complex cytochrome b subunit
MSRDASTQRLARIRAVAIQLLVYALISAVLSGVLVSMHYVPTPSAAALSIGFIQRNVFAGALVHRLHSVSALLGLLCALACLFVVPVTRDRRAWAGSLLAAVVVTVTLCLQYLPGRVLVGDRVSMALLRLMCRDVGMAGDAALPELLARLFARTWIVHILLLPAVLLLAVAVSSRSAPSLLQTAQRSPVPFWRGFAVFAAALVILSALMGPVPGPVLEYGVPHSAAAAPWYARWMALMVRHLSFPVLAGVAAAALLAGPLTRTFWHRRHVS